MQPSTHERVSGGQAAGSRIVIVNTRAEAGALALRLEAALLARGYEVPPIGATKPRTDAGHLSGMVGNQASPVNRLKSLLLRSPLVRSLALVWRLVNDRAKLSRVLAKIKPAAIVMFDDRPLTPNYLVRMLAAGSNIPVALIPFAVSTVEADVKGREDKAPHRMDQPPGRMLKRFIARRLPNQVYGESGERLLFHSVWDTLALMICGMLPQNPWYVGGSCPEIVCAGGGDQRAYFLEAGVPADRIILTGQPLLDELAKTRESAGAIRDRLTLEYTLTQQRPLVICAVPQYAEHGLLDWDSHGRLTEELFSTLAGSGASVLLSLHPKSKRPFYESCARTYGLPILKEPLADVLAAADLLVATFSSTVTWAIGLGIPAFVVATIHADYQLYRDMPGVLVVEDHAALAGELARFVRDSDFRAELSAATTGAAERVGRPDGKAIERVASAIDQAVGRKPIVVGREFR